MMNNYFLRTLPVLLVISLLAACHDAPRPPSHDIAATPEELDRKVTGNIQSSLLYAIDHNGLIGDSVQLFSAGEVRDIYEKREFATLWTGGEQWKPLGDSLLEFIEQAKLYGLFPEDYHFEPLAIARQKILADSPGKADRKDAMIWANAELMLTDAFVHLINDLKLGRLPQDSMTLRKDSVLAPGFCLDQLALLQNRSLKQVLEALEPELEGYRELKSAIPAFLDSVDDRAFTLVPFPREKSPDFKKNLQKRLYEGGFLIADTAQADSLQLAEAVKKFQRNRAITVDGRVGDETVRLLNTTDRDRFIRIAITLDRYKQLPEKLPLRYIWVNLPGYYLKFWENDTLQWMSKIICGKPVTRTPLLTSSVSELVTYPQWTIPTSIIVKEILPAVKRDPGYLARKGFSLIDSRGDEIDPFTVEWSKYSKGIPYKVVQGSGDDNALGILKFNFPNKYAVYLHDTNQRYLFTQATRSLSHGCVRVQEWQKLAYNIVQYDNKNELRGRPSSQEDSLTAWLERKEKHHIPVRNRVPLYIRYLTCEGKNGRIMFYDDIYGEDKALQERCFAGKK